MSRLRRLQHPAIEGLSELPSPAGLRTRHSLLKRSRDDLRTSLDAQERELAAVQSFLSLAPRIESALQLLGQQMFAGVVSMLEEKLTIALQEVLEQPLTLKVATDYKRGSATVDFYIERDGQREDIMRGQGGSVVNILSVGLRMFALTTLDAGTHRRFLVLDEPDGWLRPELVPRLVKIIHDAGKALGFQVILISHHDVELFREYADRIYVFQPQTDGSVRVFRSDEEQDADYRREPELELVPSALDL